MALLSCLLLISFITEQVNLVHADPTASIRVYFEQKFWDKNGAVAVKGNQNFIYELRAKATGNPMPIGSIGDVYEISLAGNKTGYIDILVDRPGVFEYTLKASNKNDFTGFTKKGEIEYRITIYSLKTINNELEEILIVQDSAGAKVVDPPFEYIVEEGVTKIPTPSLTRPPKPRGTAKTGDTTKIGTLIALAGLSAGAIILVIIKKRKRYEE